MAATIPHRKNDRRSGSMIGDHFWTPLTETNSTVPTVRQNDDQKRQIDGGDVKRFFVDFRRSRRRMADRRPVPESSGRDASIPTGGSSDRHRRREINGDALKTFPVRSTAIQVIFDKSVATKMISVSRRFHRHWPRGLTR